MSYSRVLVVGLLAAMVSVASSQPKREIDKTLPLKKDGRVVIDTYKGSITIDTWDREQVQIHVVIEPDEDFFHNDEEMVNKTDVRIDGSDREVLMKSDYDRVNRKGWSWFNFDDNNSGNLPLVHYTIKMPRTAQLRVKDYKSKSDIRNITADVDFNTYKGEVDIAGLNGALELESYKGEVRVDFVKLAGSSKFDTYKGTIEIGLPKNSAFNIETDFEKHAEFDSDFDVAMKYKSRKWGNDDIRGSVNGGGPTLHLKTYKGTYRLKQQ